MTGPATRRGVRWPTPRSRAIGRRAHRTPPPTSIPSGPIPRVPLLDRNRCATVATAPRQRRTHGPSSAWGVLYRYSRASAARTPRCLRSFVAPDRSCPAPPPIVCGIPRRMYPTAPRNRYGPHGSILLRSLPDAKAPALERRAAVLAGASRHRRHFGHASCDIQLLEQFFERRNVGVTLDHGTYRPKAFAGEAI